MEVNESIADAGTKRVSDLVEIVSEIKLTCSDAQSLEFMRVSFLLSQKNKERLTHAQINKIVFPKTRLVEDFLQLILLDNNMRLVMW